MATHDGDVPPRGATDYAAYTMDDIAAMTQDELRDALVAATTRNTALTSENEALMAKNSVLEDVLKIERARVRQVVKVREVVKVIVEEYVGRGVDAVEQDEFIGVVEARMGWNGKTEFKNVVAKELQKIGMLGREGMLYLLED